MTSQPEKNKQLQYTLREKYRQLDNEIWPVHRM